MKTSSLRSTERRLKVASWVRFSNDSWKPNRDKGLKMHTNQHWITDIELKEVLLTKGSPKWKEEAVKAHPLRATIDAKLTSHEKPPFVAMRDPAITTRQPKPVVKMRLFKCIFINTNSHCVKNPLRELNEHKIIIQKQGPKEKILDRMPCT